MLLFSSRQFCRSLTNQETRCSSYFFNPFDQFFWKEAVLNSCSFRRCWGTIFFFFPCFNNLNPGTKGASPDWTQRETYKICCQQSFRWKKGSGRHRPGQKLVTVYQLAGPAWADSSFQTFSDSSLKTDCGPSAVNPERQPCKRGRCLLYVSCSAHPDTIQLHKSVWAREVLLHSEASRNLQVFHFPSVCFPASRIYPLT